MVGSGPFPDASTCTSLRMNPMATEGYAGYRISFDNVEFSASWPCRRGFGGCGRPQCVEPVEGYAPVALPYNSTIVFIFRSPGLSSFQTLVKRLHLNGGSLAVWGKL